MIHLGLDVDSASDSASAFTAGLRGVNLSKFPVTASAGSWSLRSRAAWHYMVRPRVQLSQTWCCAQWDCASPVPPCPDIVVTVWSTVHHEISWFPYLGCQDQVWLVSETSRLTCESSALVSRTTIRPLCNMRLGDKPWSPSRQFDWVWHWFQQFVTLSGLWLATRYQCPGQHWGADRENCGPSFLEQRCPWAQQWQILCIYIIVWPHTCTCREWNTVASTSVGISATRP